MDRDEINYDFKELSERYPSLKPFITTTTRGCNTTVYFKFNCEGQYELLKITLLDQFRLILPVVHIEGHLIPTAPSRLMYLSLINQVLKESEIMTDNVSGLDVGSGPYAIFGLLAARKYGWKMTGIDIDKVSIVKAKEIVSFNDLNVDMIMNDGLLGLAKSFEFVCCNPPFYESMNELEKGTEAKEVLKRDAALGTTNELIYEDGGEIGFIVKLIEESLKNDLSVWYSSLICKRKSICAIMNSMTEKKCLNWFFRDFVAGKSKKWVIFWSWRYYRPMVYTSNQFKGIACTVIELRINLVITQRELSRYEFLTVGCKDGILSVTTKTGDVWSRSFRRRKTDERLLKIDKYVFKITPMHIQWLYGSQQKTFQSFHTLVRKINASI